MKTGIIVSFFDFRADVRALIAEFISEGNQVVLFYRESERQNIERHPIPGVEYRLIREENRTLRNRLLEYSYLLFKKLPVSRTNYFLIELFKISNNPSPKSRFLHRLILNFQRLYMNFLSYDFLIKNLRYSAQTELSDINRFIGFTEFQSDYMAARLLKENRPLSIYVYSWDHPCKHTRFSRFFQYKVWSEGIREDLITLQGLPSSNIQVCGSSQFSYIYDFIQRPQDQTKVFDFPYVYYCCAIGIIDLIPQETAIIHSLAIELEKCRPDLKLVVRPYPLLQNWNLYQPLFSLQNVVFDDGFRTNPFPDFTAASKDKFRKLQAAELVLHSGSTIGLEACFLGVASLLIDFGYGQQRSGLSVYGFIHQYQNEKYLLHKGLGLSHPSGLSDVLGNLSRVVEKNRHAASSFPLISLKDLCRRLLQ